MAVLLAGCATATTATLPPSPPSRSPPSPPSPPSLDTEFYIGAKSVSVVGSNDVKECVVAGERRPELAGPVLQYLRSLSVRTPRYRTALQRIVYFDSQSPSDIDLVYRAHPSLIALDLRAGTGLVVISFPRGADEYCVSTRETDDIVITLSLYNGLRTD
jgi:hypothetical protein